MSYLQRKIDADLHEWKNSESRKPLLLVRGRKNNRIILIKPQS